MQLHGLLKRLRLDRSGFVLALAVATAGALIFISETAYKKSTEAMLTLDSNAKARQQIEFLLRKMVDAEGSQRGFLLTGRDSYLEPYHDALDDIEASLQMLSRKYSHDRYLAETMQALDVAVRSRLSELEEKIRLYRAEQHEAWRAIMLTDIGKDQMDAVRLLSAQLIVEEGADVALNRKHLYDTLWISRLGVAAMAVLSLLALVMYLRKSAALEAQQLEQARAIQSERDLLETEVRHRTAQLTELTQHLQTAREDERGRLARELHDELGALLTSAKLDVARVRSRVAAASPDAARQLMHLNETLNHGIALKRRIIEDLRPSSLTNLGLLAALEIQAREFEERSGVKVECQLSPVNCSPSVQLTIYRVVQEAFTNIAKYANARSVRVALVPLAGRAHITISDDGRGFDPARSRGTSHGLLGMHYRVEGEGGILQIDSAPGRGTRISAALPLAHSEPQQERALAD